MAHTTIEDFIRQELANRKAVGNPETILNRTYLMSIMQMQYEIWAAVNKKTITQAQEHSSEMFNSNLMIVIDHFAGLDPEL